MDLTYNLGTGNAGTGPTPNPIRLPAQKDFPLWSGAAPTHSQAILNGVLTDVLFIGWSATAPSKIFEAGEGAMLPTLITTINLMQQSTTVYAVWGFDSDNDGIPDVLLDFDVIYNANTGTNAPVSHLGVINGASINLRTEIPTAPASPTGTGVVLFMGWSETQIGVLLVEDALLVPDLRAAGSSLTVNENMTLFAVWGLDTTDTQIPDVIDCLFDITFNANTGTNAPASQLDIVNSSFVNLRTEIPTAPASPSGTVLFMGWSETQVGVLLAADTLLIPSDLRAAGSSIAVDRNIDLFAVWGLDTTGNGIPDVLDDAFSITFNANTGTNAPASQLGIINGATVNLRTGVPAAPAPPAGSGTVLFMGWSETQVGVLLAADTFLVPSDLRAAGSSITVDRNVDLFAVWGLDTTGNGIPDVLDAAFGITFNANTGTNAPAPQTGIINGSAVNIRSGVPTAPASPTGSGTVLFMGWSETQVGILLAADTLLIPSDLRTTGSSITVDRNFALFAVWGLDTTGTGIPDVMDAAFAVTYNANTGTNAPASQTDIINGSAINLRIDVPTAPAPPTGSGTVLFMGWSEIQVGILLVADTLLIPSDLRDAGSSITVDRNIDLFAVWGLDTTGTGIPDVIDGTFRITFNANGGTVAPSDQIGAGSTNLRTDVPAAPASPTSSGTVVFMGWSETQVGILLAGDALLIPSDLKTAGSGITVDNDTVLFAVWGLDTTGMGIPDVQMVFVSLIYDLRGGTGGPTLNPRTALFGTLHTLSAAGPTHADVNGIPVVFAGWSTVPVTNILAFNANLPSTMITGLTITADTTVYAVWIFGSAGDGSGVSGGGGSGTGHATIVDHGGTGIGEGEAGTGEGRAGTGYEEAGTENGEAGTGNGDADTGYARPGAGEAYAEGALAVVLLFMLAISVFVYRRAEETRE